jgi:1-acyl-sn-glycerol-3-phosphate acyltransferase
MVFGAPITLDAVAWPRSTATVADASARIREHLRQALADAKKLTGRELPGPLPKVAAS